jgi:hypothetical protein
MRFETSDVTRMTISSTGISCFACQICAPVGLFSGCVGIGCTVPGALLHIAGTPGQNNPSIRLTDSSISGNGGNVYISADKEGVGYNNLTTIAFTHTFKGGASATNYLTIDTSGAACFASTISGTTIYGSTAVCSAVGYFSGCVGIGTCTPTDKLDIYGNNTNGAIVVRGGSSQTGRNIYLFSGGISATGTLLGVTKCVNQFIYSNNSRLTIGTADAYSLGFSTSDTLRAIIDSSGIACFASNVCAANFSSPGFLRIHNTMKTFAISKNFGERESDANYFRISSSAANGYQVMIYSVAQNGSVGWVQSQLYQAATAPYWGGWVGTSGAITTTGSGAGYISSVVNGNDGTLTFRVTTGNNGTVTTGTMLSYIQITAFSIDNITLTAL